MGFFSRNKDVVEPVAADTVPFESLRRSPRRRTGPRADPLDTDDPSSPIDPAQSSKTRARRRLIGAVALALAAVVFVPMLFDRTPVAPVDDIALQIPDRDSPFEGRKGVPDPSRTPLTPSAALPPTDPAPPAPAETVPSASAVAPVEKAPVEKVPTDKGTVDKAPAVAAPPSDDPRAVAALEGRSGTAPADSSAGKTFAVQIAAFSAADKARGLRDTLTANGLKSYTEAVTTPQGQRTRVRLGPFPSREAADRAKQKLKTMKLDGSVVAL